MRQGRPWVGGKEGQPGPGIGGLNAVLEIGDNIFVLSHFCFINKKTIQSMNRVSQKSVILDFCVAVHTVRVDCNDSVLLSWI